MRIPSGTTDQYLYFVALDSIDHVTRKTGLSSFTVYRSRNGAAAAAYTTPTIAELSSANMPGVYSLLLDEDMTIGSGNSSEEVCLHITCSGMAPVTRTFELYRPIVTEGETLTVSSGGATLKADALGSSELAGSAATEIATAILTRSIDSDEGSATAKSLLWLIAMALNKSDVGSTHAGKVTVFKTDNSTEMFTQTVTQTSVDPITSKAEAS